MSLKYEKLSRDELLDKVNQFERELKGYVDRIDQRYNVFFERNLAGLYRSRTDGKIIECNDALAKILGYESRDDLIGFDARKLYVNIEDRKKQLDQLSKKKHVRNRKVALLKKDGSQIWASISASQITDDANKEMYLEGTLIDITELISTQDLLKQNELNYKNMLDNSPYGIIIHLDNTIRYFNNRAEEILNKKLKEGQKLIKELQGHIPAKNSKKGMKHLDRLEIKQGKESVYLDVYIKQILFENQEMTELSFVDIMDRIELEEERLKTEVFQKLNDQLKSEIEKKEVAEKELTSSLNTNMKQAARLKSIFENESHIIFSLNRKYQITSLNGNFVRLFQKMFDVTPKINDNPLEYKAMGKEAREMWKAQIDSAFTGKPSQFEARTFFRDGTKNFTSVYLNPIREKDKVTQVSIIGHDITDKVLAESQLTESLKEKDILLKEVHHRVKNNLQVISSIFNLQGAFSTEQAVKDVLRESQSRIKSMAYIHESLYKSANFGKINFEEYLQKLCNNLIQTYAVKQNQVSLLTETEEVLMHLDQAIPCGLIVNEIISNSLKHAFGPEDSGIIVAYLKAEKNKVKLKLVDNGVGIPNDVIEKESNTLGFQLIQTLTEQLHGEINFDGSNGTSVQLQFEMQTD